MKPLQAVLRYYIPIANPKALIEFIKLKKCQERKNEKTNLGKK